jgi:hypothetical protein
MFHQNVVPFVDHFLELYRQRLDLEALNLVLEGPDLAHEVTGFVRGDACCDDGPGNAALLRVSWSGNMI